MSNVKKILVIGATGNQGGAIVQALLPKGYQIRTITRNPESPKARQLIKDGVEVLKGDFTDKESLMQAATGMDTVYAMTTPFEDGVEAETAQGIALADAIKQAGVGHFIFGSVADADKKTGIPHFESKYKVEEHIKSLGIPYTISAPVFFMDNYLTPWFTPALKEGKLTFALPSDRKLQHVSVKNIGEFVATLVEKREAVFSKRIDYAGDEISGDRVAAVLSEVSGKKIVFEGFDPEFMRKDSADMADMYVWFNDTGYSADIASLKVEYPEVGWQTFAQWAKAQDWSILE